MTTEEIFDEINEWMVENEYETTEEISVVGKKELWDFLNELYNRSKQK